MKTMEITENFPEILTSFILFPEASVWFFVIRIVFIFFSLVSLFFIVFWLWRTSWLGLRYLCDWSEFFTYRPYAVRKIEKDWKKIMARLETGLESEYKLSVIEADNTMDETLKIMGYQGASLAERLNNLSPIVISNLDGLKEAHQTRNNIIHDPNYILSLDQAKKTLAVFEKAFDDLGAF